MLDILRAWLNGKRDYFAGVGLLAQMGASDALIRVLSQGCSTYTRKRLDDELMAICKKLKEAANEEANAPDSKVITHKNKSVKNSFQTPNPQKIKLASAVRTPETETKQEKPVNEALYKSCKEKADNRYKEVMNERAVLFAMTKQENDFEDINTPEKIAERAILAISVVQGYQKLSVLYDQADYVFRHGVLPSDGVVEEEDEYTHLSEALVKPTLDNLRKNYNKMKKREATPERVALLQKHEANIKKLEAKWHSLQH